METRHVTKGQSTIKFYERDGLPIPQHVMLCLGIYQYFNLTLAEVATHLRQWKIKRPGSRRVWNDVAVAQVIHDHAGTCIVKCTITTKENTT